MLLPLQKLPPKGWWVFIIRPTLRFLFSFALLFGGLTLLISQIVYPLFLNSSQEPLAPIQQTVLGIISLSAASPLENIDLPAEQPLAISSGVNNTAPNQFYLSVPRLGIVDAAVETNSLSLTPDTMLGHYRGTSLPGTLGTAFIYGHSTLPYFFNPQNYKTIFATLPTLVTGDIFLIRINEITYQYTVAATKILPPPEVDPIKDYGLEMGSSSSVVLMTCYPPGLSTERFLAIGKLVF